MKKAGREWKGLSPFKQEKTPSFTVNDQKGFYHCFATGEHGDIFKFLMATEGLAFPEAVSRLAEEAGVTLPKPSARDVRQEETRDRLLSLMEASARYFEAMLLSGAGRDAANYLLNRGVSDAARIHFRIGYEPGDRQALRRHLAGEGFTDAEMIQAGMLIGGPDIQTPYSRFRGRILFPITDLGGRIIGFGGRALDPSVPAKYLNSPETPLFHKGSVLFNAASARVAAHKAGRIVVGEGYMDVVALWQAGFENAVAPLGTAVTERQLDLLWRFAEPVFCLDGDEAGRKAATRALETALPRLTAERQLTFAFLPDGLDPDDLIRQQGPAAMQKVLDGALKVFDYLWQICRQEVRGDAAEDLARLESLAQKRIALVPDENLQRHYAQALRSAIYEAGRYRRRAPGASEVDWRTRVREAGQRSYGRRGPPGPASSPRRGAGHTSAVAQSPLVMSATTTSEAGERLIVLAMLLHPWLIEEDAEEIADLEFASRPHARLRDAILEAHASGLGLDSAGLIDHVRQLGTGAAADFLSHVMGQGTPKSLTADADPSDLMITWRDLLKQHAEGRADAARQAFASDTGNLSLDDTEYERLLEELGSSRPEPDETET